MNLNKKLIIISNEKTSINEGKTYCENIDLKSIPEGLNKSFDVSLILKKSNIECIHQINLEKGSVSDLKLFFHCDTMFRAKGYLWFCNEIKDVSYEE